MTIGGRILLILAAVMTVLPVRAQTPPPTAAPANASASVVTFLETGAPSAAAAAALLRKLAAASRKEDGNAGFLALRESGRPGRFAVIEAWRDKAALDAHETAAKAAYDGLQKLLVSPPDRRPCVGLDVAAPAAGAEGSATVYVLTHVDVVPPAKDQAIGLVKQLAAESSKDPGVVLFDVLQQANRANHLFLVEAWRDRAAFDAHTMAEHTRAFRAKLLPLQGALYDERMYAPIL
jgi:quinol monooxygenase YgiN